LIEARAKNDDETVSNQLFWKRFYFVIGFGAFCSGIYVGGYAVNIYPYGSLNFTMGVTTLLCAFFIAVSTYFYGETAAKALLQLSQNAGRAKN